MHIPVLSIIKKYGQLNTAISTFYDVIEECGVLWEFSCLSRKTEKLKKAVNAATVTKMVQRCTGIDKYQWNKTESLRINPTSVHSWFSTRVPRLFSGGKTSLFISGAWTTAYPYAKE